VVVVVMSLLVFSVQFSGVGMARHHEMTGPENEVAAMGTGGGWFTMTALS